MKVSKILISFLITVLLLAGGIWYLNYSKDKATQNMDKQSENLPPKEYNRVSLETLIGSPEFYSNKTVVVGGKVMIEDSKFYLESGEEKILLSSEGGVYGFLENYLNKDIEVTATFGSQDDQFVLVAASGDSFKLIER